MKTQQNRPFHHIHEKGKLLGVGMKTDGNGRKNSSPVFVSIFLETGSDKKNKTKTDRDVRKLTNMDGELEN